jgi:hypothetical protein
VADGVNRDARPAISASLEPAAPRDVAWVWYLVALVVYVALALVTLSARDNVVLLNWIVGPLFPVIALYAVPTAAKSLATRLTAK